MVQQFSSDSAEAQIEYPDSDGQPMSDNTLQFQWIVTIKENLELLFANDPNVFVAGDLLWYPVEGDNKTRRAPDAMVVFGRPKGYRGSYKQWLEDDISPQVVFEILSPGNTRTEMELKRRFYQKYGVEEYYLYHPQKNELSGWIAQNHVFEEISEMSQWQSPRLGIRFELLAETMMIYQPDGTPFVSLVELNQEKQLIEQEKYIVEENLQEEQKLRQEEQKLRQEAEDKLAKLQEKLRSLGLNPDDV